MFGIEHPILLAPMGSVSGGALAAAVTRAGGLGIIGGGYGDRAQLENEFVAAGNAPVGVGFIGTGMISDTYLENLTSFPDVRLMILGDLDQQRAQAQAEKYNVPQWGSNDDVLTHPNVEIIVNLTIPVAHAEVASQAIAAGKHVWSEKPISVDRASGRAAVSEQARQDCRALRGGRPARYDGAARRAAAH